MDQGGIEPLDLGLLRALLVIKLSPRARALPTKLLARDFVCKMVYNNSMYYEDFHNLFRRAI